MALEELSTTMSKLTFNFFGSESEKKVMFDSSCFVLFLSCLVGPFLRHGSSVALLSQNTPAIRVNFI